MIKYLYYCMKCHIFIDRDKIRNGIELSDPCPRCGKRGWLCQVKIEEF